MTRSGGSPRRSGTGCATAVGVALILVGGFALAVNLRGVGVLFRLLDLLPFVAVWWPALLVIWGVSKLVARVRTGTLRFGFLEVVLLLSLVLFGSALSLAHRTLAGHELRFRFTEISRWAHEQVAPLPQHAFVSERVAALPPGEVEVVLTLPAGGILVRELGEEDDPAPNGEAGPGAAGEPARETGDAPPGREAHFTLTSRIRAGTAAAAEARAAAIRLEAGPWDPQNAQFPVRVEDAGESEAAYDLVVALPPGVRVFAVSGRGAVRIEGAFPRVSARTRDAPLVVEGAAGAVTLAARDGNIRAASVGGPVEIRARRAPIEVESVAGAVDIESDAAPVWVEGAGGEVAVRVEGGSAEVADAVGPVAVTARIAPVTVREVLGEAQIEADHGPVRVHGVRGAVRVRSETASVEVREAGAGVDLGGGSGTLLLDGISGTTTVRAEGGTVTALNFLGSLVVDGGDADLEVATAAVNGPVELTTAAGEIRVGLPSAGSFSISAEADEVESDFALEREPGTRRWSGSVGGGAGEVRVFSETGDAVIRKRGGP